MMPEHAKNTRAELFSFSSKAWDDIKGDVVPIDTAAFGYPGQKTENAESFSREQFATPQGVVVLLKDQQSKVIGYSLARPDGISQTVARIIYTAIHPEFQGMGLVGKIMDLMENELRQRGFVEFRRRARIDNGYAQKIEKHYGERVISSFPDRSPNYRCIVIKL